MPGVRRPVRVEIVGETDIDAAEIVDRDDPDAPEIIRLGHGRVRVRHPVGRGGDKSGVVAALPPGAGPGSYVEVVVDGWRFELAVEDAARAALRRRATRSADADAPSASAEIRAIIPGRIAAVRVATGDTVVAGQTLLVVEAMKMQNELRAQRAGTVERVAVGEGQTIDRGDLLLVVR